MYQTEYMNIVNVWHDLMDEGVITSNDTVDDVNDAIRYRMGDWVTDDMIENAFTTYLAAGLADLASS